MNFDIKNICCIGAGYVGGPTMTVFARHCPELTINVVDINSERIKAWNNKDLNKLPIYEPGLKDLINKCRDKNLFFTTKVQESISVADMIFISVNTPTKEKGVGAGQASDLRWIEASAREIAKYAKDNAIIVEKSTLPVKTAETIKQILDAAQKKVEHHSGFFVLSNPEFLAEGTAIKDLEDPDRVLIGGDNEDAIDVLIKIYQRWVDPKKIIRTNLWSAELSKLCANAFLAQRISSINSISALCEKTGADVEEVAKAIGADNRIGSKFLNSGVGFGGSCFKKDILNLIYLSNYYGLREVALYWGQVLEMNSWQAKRLSKIIVEKLFRTLTNKKIAILGFAFKANTNDTRESPAIEVCKSLIEEGANLSIYDPKVNKKQISKDLGQENKEEGVLSQSGGFWTHAENISYAAKNADAIVLLTDWEEFKNINWFEVSKNLRAPSWVFDFRNIININETKKYGINVWRVGFEDSKYN